MTENSNELPDPQPIAWNTATQSKWTQSPMTSSPDSPPIAFNDYGKTVIAQGEKSLLIATILASIFFVTGIAGLHRFYVGKIGTGILMLITFGGIGIWAVVDLIVLVTGNFRDANGRNITSWQLPN